MNFAILERMVREGDLSKGAFRYLLDCRGECEWLDYKEELHFESDAQICAFAKDALALKNVGGGYMVAGVKDKSWDQVGLHGGFGYDSKQLRDKVLRASGVSLELDVVTHELDQDGSATTFAVVLVRSSKKRSKRRTPTVVSKDFCAGKSFGLRRGEIYVRRGDSTTRVSSQGELEELLDRLEEQSDADAVQAVGAASSFAIDDGTYRLLDRGFDRFVGRGELRERVLDAVTGDPRIWIVNVHGPGGVGKSALVNWVAHELYKARRFEAMLQLTAKETMLTDDGIRQFSRSLYSLENLLDHILQLFQEKPEEDLVSKKALATEILSAWNTLLILDNMETVSDGRILAFVQGLPPSSKARVLLTSRTKTGGWELPIAVVEMTQNETREFIKLKSSELAAHFPDDEQTVARVAEASGGLPLATQWIVGQYKRTRRLDAVLDSFKGKDSPVLEFSFRNIWGTLSAEARTVLAIMSIFDGPTSVQQLSLATEMPPDFVEGGLTELTEVTLVNRSLQQSDGRVL